METNKPELTTETPPLVTPETSSTTGNDLNKKSSSKNKSVVLVLVLLILGLFSLLVYLYYQNTQLRQQVELNKLENPVVVTCEYNGQTYEVGEGFTAKDGCNSCSCSETGEVACTAMACENVDEKVETDPTVGWKAYSTDSYTFKYPQDWNIYDKGYLYVENGIQKSFNDYHDVMLSSQELPYFGEGRDNPFDGISISFYSDGRTYDELLRQSKTMPGFEEFIIGGKKALKVEGYVGQGPDPIFEPGKNNEVVYYFDARKNGQQLQVILQTYSNESLSEAEREIFDQILSTFEFVE